MDPKLAEGQVGLQTERRISWLTLLIGFALAATAGLRNQKNWAAGLVIGAVLSWFSFRWLRRGLEGLVMAATAQAGIEKPRVPVGTYFLMVFRYGLIALAVYVIFEYLKVPLLSMIVGLCALGAATIVASVYEILHPVD